MSVHDDDIIIVQRKTLVCRQKEHTSEDLPSRSEPASSSRPLRTERTVAVHTASTTGSDPQASARSVTPIPISFDALSVEENL